LSPGGIELLTLTKRPNEPGLLESAGEKLSRVNALDGVVRRSHELEEAERLLRLSLEEVALERSTLSELKRSDPRQKRDRAACSKPDPGAKRVDCT
jgi:hypothetical protein